MLKKTIIKVAIIGCGDIAGGYDERKEGEGIFSHAGAFQSIPNVSIVAASDVDESRLKSFCRYWKVPNSYTDYKLMIKENTVDIISVCTPDSTHYSILMDLLEMGKTKVIFTEKPFVEKVNEGINVLELAKRKKISIVLNNQRHFEECHKELGKRVANGEIGKVQSVCIYYVKGITHIGCTIISNLRYIVGDIEKVQALPPRDLGSYPGDPTIDCVLYLKDGSKAILLGCDKYGYNYSIYEMDIIGTHGRIRYEENGDMIRIFKIKQYDHYSGYYELKEDVDMRVETDMQFSMLHIAKYVADLSTKNDVLDLSLAEDGLVDIKIIEAIYESVKNNNCLFNIAN